MSGTVQKKAVRGRPFQPGVSGNPGGKPKGVEHVTNLAKQHTPAAIAALVKALNSPRERVPAAIALLDRGWGKPVQMVLGDPERPIAIDFQWADAGAGQALSAPNAHTDTRAVAHQIEGAIIDAALDDKDDTT